MPTFFLDKTKVYLKLYCLNLIIETYEKREHNIKL